MSLIRVERGITLHQPWASAMALNLKTYETRSWAIGYNGWVAIHAGKVFDDQALMWIEEDLRDYGVATSLLRAHAMQHRGCIVAIGYLVQCIPTHEVSGISDTERALGDYGPLRFAWQFVNIQPTECHPMRGYQGLWHLPADFVVEVPSAA